MRVDDIAGGHELTELLQQLLGLAHVLRVALNAQAALARLEADVQPFADESEMRVINAEDLWELGGIVQLDLFAQCLSQAAFHTSMKSGSRCEHPRGAPRLLNRSTDVGGGPPSPVACGVVSQSLKSCRPNIPQNKSSMQCSRSTGRRSSRLRRRIVARQAPAQRSPPVTVERGVELAADVLDGPFVDDFFTHQIRHIEYIDGPRRLGGDLGQMNVNPDLEQRRRDQVQQAQAVLGRDVDDR